MKQGRTLAETLVELQRQQAIKRDIVAPATWLSMQNNGTTMNLNTPDAIETLETTDLFHRQIAASLGIPAKYYDTMREQKPELLARNVNEWLQDRTKQNYMLRTFTEPKSRVRALLSDRYKRIDNLQIAETVLPLFAGKPGMEVISSEVTDSRLYLKIVNHRLEKEVLPGDLVQSGVIISNSEVGLGAVSVQPLLYRLVCTNGMVVNDLGTRKTHLGRRVQSSFGDPMLFAEDTEEADDKAFLLKLRDITLAAIEEARFDQVLKTLAATADAKITGKVADVVELTAKSYALNQTEAEGVLDHLIRGGDLSLYGLSNAITRTSQDVASYDRATELEAIGWNVATMPTRQWNEFNK